MLPKFSFAIDRGGTFTDIYCEYVIQGERRTKICKLLSEDPRHYDDAPAEGIRRIIQEVLGQQVAYPIPTEYINWIRMGTTVATNALLERKGEKFVFCITQGFGDTMIIGNQSRPRIFELGIDRGQVLSDYVLEVEERVQLDPEGSEQGVTGERYKIISPLNTDKVTEQLQKARELGFSSMAVALVHGYSFTRHEMVIKEIAGQLGFSQISLSSEIMPMVKIYPRACTVAADAYLTPCIKKYLQNFIEKFDQGIHQIPLLFMQSDGTLKHYSHFIGSRAILSGPAGGVVGYSSTHTPPLIGFDMGGTSTDVSRFDGTHQLVFESKISNIQIQSPHLDISTVAAGGGSRLFYQSGLFVVGPESAGANPGPVCYGKGGFLTVTDANLMLNRILPEYFPKIFGEKENEALNFEKTYEAFKELTEEINRQQGSEFSEQEIAHGFVKVANESMCRPIRAITQARGFDPKLHTLSCFGGAGGQHACAIARNLGITKVYVHKYSGILSAYGMGLADVSEEKIRPCGWVITENCDPINEKLNELSQICEEMSQEIYKSTFEGQYTDVEFQQFLHLRFEGSDTVIDVPNNQNSILIFKQVFAKEHGFCFTNREVIVEQVRVKVLGKLSQIKDTELEEKEQGEAIAEVQTYFELEGALAKVPTKVFQLESLAPGQQIEGPAIILNNTSTILIEPNSQAMVDKFGNIEIALMQVQSNFSTQKDPILLSVFGHRYMSIAEQMGKILQRIAISTNIKERLDYSCAIFAADGSLVANAPHLPVHLGSMQEAVKYQIQLLQDTWKEGEVVMSNHPVAGGTHLPDITVMTPVFYQNSPIFYLASRGHHADIGGITPGSMPAFSRFLSEEGLAVESLKIVENGVFKEEEVKQLFIDNNSRNLLDNLSDLKAQIAANNRGSLLISELIEEYSMEVVQAYMRYIQEASRDSVIDLLTSVATKLSPNLHAIDYMDDGTPINLHITIQNNSCTFDFTGTGPQVLSNLNAPESVVKSAIIYCLRCMVNQDIPLNQGCLEPVEVIIPKASILSPTRDAAVVGGNVLTSQRLTDVIFKAFGACAASQGCMNNLTFGNQRFGFYETIAGGEGACPDRPGASGVHTHMTNTQITDVEIMERRYPVRIERFCLRKGSGGRGKQNGGEGVIREFVFLEQLQVNILSERRAFQPFGLMGGENGATGRNL